MSVTDIRKNYPLSLKPCPKVPFLRPPSLIRLPQSTSEECSTGLVNKTYSRGTCLWVKWKAAFAWVKLPSQENKHSYNLCAQIDRKWPCVERSPPITGTHPQSLCSPRALLICFYRKHERYSFTGKFTIWSFESIGGPGSGDKRKTDWCHSDTSDTQSKSSHKTWWTFFLIRLFTITRKTNIINKLYHNYRATAEARSFPSKCLAF